MPEPDSISTLGTLVLMLPFGLLLALAVFGVDERLAAPKRRSVRVRFCEMGANGQPEMADPDGAAWAFERVHRIAARGDEEDSGRGSRARGAV
ncbi:MAG: hypothetical protein ACLGSD_15490 [Acidobacteriota bacterium]